MSDRATAQLVVDLAKALELQPEQIAVRLAPALGPQATDNLLRAITRLMALDVRGDE